MTKQYRALHAIDMLMYRFRTAAHRNFKFGENILPCVCTWYLLFWQKGLQFRVTRTGRLNVRIASALFDFNVHDIRTHTTRQTSQYSTKLR